MDKDFCGTWNRMTAEKNRSTAKSRTGCIITFMGCAIAWISKLQTQIALSTTEAKYIATLMVMRGVIQITNLLNKQKDKEFVRTNSTKEIH